MPTPMSSSHFGPRGGCRVRHAAAELAQVTFAVVDTLPPDPRGALAGQMRRAAGAVYAHLAEGAGRLTRAERAEDFSTARRSLRELEAHADAAVRSGALARAEAAAVRSHCRQVGRMLSKLCRAWDN